MMNNPMNVVNTTPQPGSMDGVNRYPYGDSGLENDPRMGMVGPNQNSGMAQNMVRGTGLNGAIPYNAQQQPSSAAEEPMEGMRLSQDAANRGLVANPFMGVSGSPTPLPGNPTMMQGSQTNQTLGLIGFQNLEGVQPPGSTPTKTGKKKGKK
jgi:hypothetical protein